MRRDKNKINVLKKGLLIVVLLISFSNFAQNEAFFEQGKTLYKAEKYQDAITVWGKIEKNKQHSSSLFYNLGNAHYKLNNIGLSIYYYEKALQLSPTDKNIKNNLAFAQNATVDAIEPLPKTLFAKWYKTISSIAHYNTWALVSVVFSLACIVLFLIYYFSFSESKKRLFFIGSILSALVFIVAISVAFMTYSDFKNNHPAIIFAESTEVKSEPNLGSEEVFTLHEGTKVQITNTEEDWVQIQLVDGKEGWIPVNDLKEL